MPWPYMVTELLRGRKTGKKEEKNSDTMALKNVCMLYPGDRLTLAKFTSKILINQLYSSTRNTFHFKKPQTPFPLGNLTVYHTEVFSSQIKLLWQTSKTPDSIFSRLNCPGMGKRYRFSRVFSLLFSSPYLTTSFRLQVIFLENVQIFFDVTTSAPILPGWKALPE